MNPASICAAAAAVIVGLGAAGLPGPADAAPRQMLTVGDVASPAPVSSRGPWREKFDSYPEGAAMCEREGWECWFRDPEADAFVSGEQSRSQRHSVEIQDASNLTYPQLGAVSGRWVLVAHHFISSPLNNDTFYIVNNEYDGPGRRAQWAIQLRFTPDGKVVDDLRPGNEANAIFDQWVQIRVEVDLDNDVQRTFYNGRLLSQGQWAIQGGAVEMVNLDLFSNGPVAYFDDFSLTPAADCENIELCENIRRFKAKCRHTDARRSRFKLAVTRRIVAPHPRVARNVLVAVDGEQTCLEFEPNGKKVTLKRRGLEGNVLAELLLPPNCKSPIMVNCGP